MRKRLNNYGKKLSIKNGKKFLQNAFSCEQVLLSHALDLSKSSITHYGKLGEVNEKHYIDMLRKYLPNRYQIDSAIVIDSQGHTSEQIDIVIYDQQYTPTLLDQQNHKYVPAEAVYAVFEVKPIINKYNLKYAAKKIASVRELERTSCPIPHAGGTFDPKKQFSIIGGILADKVEWKQGLGNTFKRIHSKLKNEYRIECGLAVQGYYFDTFNNNLTYSFNINKRNALIFFLFRLLQKLQSLGTVPAIDWNQYANQIDKKRR
jgi:hypothetical protein